MGQENQKVNLLIGITGSVAATMVDHIIQSFLKTDNYNIRIILSQNAKVFVLDSIANLEEYQKKHSVEFYDANDDFGYYAKETDKTCPLFVKLSQWADVLLIAPMSAHTLGKIALGLCDNLLTQVVRAWDIKKKHFFNLAMNTLMYEKQTTEQHIKTLVEDYKFIHIPSGNGLPQLGDEGIGTLAEMKVLVAAIEEEREKVMASKKTIPTIQKVI